MTLEEVLKAHSRYQVKHSLKKSLGDAYLMKTNPVFNNVRRAAVELGFEFTAKPFHHYDVLPLTQLPRILKEKTIPFRDNVTCLQEIARAAPQAFYWNEVPPLKANYVLHESAHGVARELRQIYFKKKKAPATLLKSQQVVLQALVEESFSNAVECFANVYSQDALSDEMLFKNSYIMEKPKARQVIAEAIKLIGYERAFRLVLLGFLHANFLKTKVAFKSFERVLKIVFLYEPGDMADLTARQKQVLKQAFSVGLDLDPTFTIFTNSFCFRLMGLKESLYELVSFDCLEPFEIDGQYSLWLSVLSAVV